MWMDVAELLVMLVVILIAAEVFTNALEHLGARMGISEGVTGSLFAAVGTAMPESLVPILAFTSASGSHEANTHIGVGAILGAPLMLSTLSLSLMAFFVWRARGTRGLFTPEPRGLRRDLDFFVIAYLIAGGAMFLPGGAMHDLAAVVLMLMYFLYIVLTVRDSAKLVESGHATEADRPMFFCRIGMPDNMWVVLLQLAAGLGLLVVGAHGFIEAMKTTSEHLGVSPLLLSLLLVPVATELPEKVNSITWIRRNKDTLAFGNITGAMVFQGTVLPALGLLMTPWLPNDEVLISIAVTLIAACWLQILHRQGQLRVWHLLLNGGIYVGYIAFMLLH